MRLNFKTKFPWGHETYFINKIKKQQNFIPKIHTIRRDPKRRWKPGMKIDMCTGSRFKPVVFNTEVCKSIQILTIDYRGLSYPTIWPHTYIDGIKLTHQEVEVLARNDGFSGIIEFYKWFNEDEPCLAIIHWTDFIYQYSRAPIFIINDASCS